MSRNGLNDPQLEPRPAGIDPGKPNEKTDDAVAVQSSNELDKDQYSVWTWHEKLAIVSLTSSASLLRYGLHESAAASI